MALRRSEEEPVLVVAWDRLEDHTVHFRNSDDFQAWRRLVGDCFAEAPTVEHLSLVASYFGEEE